MLTNAFNPTNEIKGLTLSGDVVCIAQKAPGRFDEK